MLRSGNRSVWAPDGSFLERRASPDSVPRNHSAPGANGFSSIYRCRSGRHFGHIPEVRNTSEHQVDCACDFDALRARPEEPDGLVGIHQKLIVKVDRLFDRESCDFEHGRGRNAVAWASGVKSIIPKSTIALESNVVAK